MFFPFRVHGQTRFYYEGGKKGKEGRKEGKEGKEGRKEVVPSAPIKAKEGRKEGRNPN